MDFRPSDRESGILYRKNDQKKKMYNVVSYQLFLYCSTCNDRSKGIYHVGTDARNGDSSAWMVETKKGKLGGDTNAEIKYDSCLLCLF